MKILVLKTDGPSTYIGVYDDQKCIAELRWESGRELARDLLSKIIELLHSVDKSIEILEGIVCYSGPGSFTSLRIGITVANTFAYAQNIPIVSATDEQWIAEGVDSLLAGVNGKIIAPFYGAEPNITLQKK